MSEQKAIAAFNEFCYRSVTQGLDIPKCTREEWIACWNLATKNTERQVPEPWRKAVADLVFAARTSGGVAGKDDALCAACDAVEALLETPSAPAPLPRSERARYACKVCGNIPDEEGMISHGKGCYTQSADGGGESYVEFEFHPAPPEAGKVQEARDTAVAIVDGILGYTVEFSSDRTAHRAMYSRVEHTLRQFLRHPSPVAQGAGVDGWIPETRVIYFSSDDINAPYFNSVPNHLTKLKCHVIRDDDYQRLLKGRE
jgi:hypothetical protein